MSSFRTILQPSESHLKIDHQSGVLSIGSCFAEHMAHRLDCLKFPTLLNPFGILYNPYSIADAVEILIQKRAFDQADIFEQEGLWFSFDHHGSFSGTNPDLVLDGINESINTGHQFLKECKVLICTLGTAYVFEYKKTNKVVANCHKLPNKDFNRRRLTQEEIIEKMSTSIQALKSINPTLQIILTVSPVRHIRDGLVENQRSKAILLLVAEQLSRDFEHIHYFPSYELQMDDLRDYRFYKSDLIHPNDQAIDYIWKAFANTFFSSDTQKLNQRIEKLVLAAEHRPLHPERSAHQRFIQQQFDKIKQITQDFPHLSFERELDLLKNGQL